MLSETEREHFRLEESYRHEVRSQLSPPKGPLTTFLNSSFGLWLLSALFITGAGGLFAKWQEQQAGAARRRETVERLDYEIGYRFSQAQVQLYAATRLPAAADREAEVRRIVRILERPPGLEPQHLYPEYSAFSLPALVGELHRHVPEKQQRDKLDQVVTHLTGLDVFFEVQKASLAEPTAVAGAIIEQLVLPRWKDTTKWYFLDGTRAAPFP